MPGRPQKAPNFLADGLEAYFRGPAKASNQLVNRPEALWAPQPGPTGSNKGNTQACPETVLSPDLWSPRSSPEQKATVLLAQGSFLGNLDLFAAQTARGFRVSGLRGDQKLPQVPRVCLFRHLKRGLAAARGPNNRAEGRRPRQRCLRDGCWHLGGFWAAIRGPKISAQGWWPEIAQDAQNAVFWAYRALWSPPRGRQKLQARYAVFLVFLVLHFW